ncbi:UNVERIFIED_CONTAM: LytTR family DNA-binding domain-containing protein [Spiribacter pallidus]|mgnify:FL=1
MKIVIACENRSLRQRLARLAAKGRDCSISGVLESTADAVDRHRVDHADAVVIGIRDERDLQAVLALGQCQPGPAIVLASGFDDPVRPTLETIGMEYVLDNVSPQRLVTALHRARPLTTGQAHAIQSMLERGGRRHLLARRPGGLNLIPVDGVRYLKAEHKYVTVQHDDGEDLIEESLCQLEEEFEPRFLRVHRSALVARDALRGLEKDWDGRTHALIDGCDDRVPVSRRRLPQVRRWLKQAGSA